MASRLARAVATGIVLEQASSLGGTVYQYPRQKLAHTQPVELPLYGALKKKEYSKEQLLELFGSLVQDHRLDIQLDHKVLGVESRDGKIRLRTREQAVRSRDVVLALGRRGTPRRTACAK